jgi:hypothetical protein
MVNNELERISEEVGHGLFQVLPQHLLGGIGKLVRPDTSLEHYCHTSLLGRFPVKKTGSWSGLL